MSQPTGYIFVDHRASPGLTETQARSMGYEEPSLVAEGKVFEADTMTCAHCCTVVIKNPLRTRERHSCMKCGGAFVCDNCAGAMLHSDYKHISFREVVDLVATGNAAMLGSPRLLLDRKG